MIALGEWRRFAWSVGIGTATLASFATIPGCVFRKEVIRVSTDGSVAIELAIEGTAEELSGGDAMPSAQSGWSVTQRLEKEGDEEKYVLETRRVFEPREALPRTFAAKDGADAGLYLDFPTTVQTEQRADGLYYIFRRVYTPRPWAYVQYWQENFFDDSIKKLSEKPVEELNRDEKLQIVQAFAGFEAYKQIALAREAMKHLGADLPVDVELQARRALLNVYEDGNDFFRSVLDRCEPLPKEEQSDCFLKESEQILAEGYAAFVGSLQRAGGPNDTAARFERAYERARGYYEITDQLGGHAFEIDVYMPGTIVAHNADKAELDARGEGYVRFEFDGKALRDRTHELIVVSRLDGQGRPGRQER